MKAGIRFAGIIGNCSRIGVVDNSEAFVQWAAGIVSIIKALVTGIQQEVTEFVVASLRLANQKDRSHLPVLDTAYIIKRDHSFKETCDPLLKAAVELLDIMQCLFGTRCTT